MTIQLMFNVPKDLFWVWLRVRISTTVLLDCTRYIPALRDLRYVFYTQWQYSTVNVVDAAEGQEYEITLINVTYNTLSEP